MGDYRKGLPFKYLGNLITSKLLFIGQVEPGMYNDVNPYFPPDFATDLTASAFTCNNSWPGRLFGIK
jgi:hypothetical protein